LAALHVRCLPCGSRSIPRPGSIFDFRLRVISALGRLRTASAYQGRGAVWHGHRADRPGRGAVRRETAIILHRRRLRRGSGVTDFLRPTSVSQLDARQVPSSWAQSTYESIGKPLDGCDTIVVHAPPELPPALGCTVARRAVLTEAFGASEASCGPAAPHGVDVDGVGGTAESRTSPWPARGGSHLPHASCIGPLDRQACTPGFRILQNLFPPGLRSRPFPRGQCPQDRGPSKFPGRIFIGVFGPGNGI